MNQKTAKFLRKFCRGDLKKYKTLKKMYKGLPSGKKKMFKEILEDPKYKLVPNSDQVLRSMNKDRLSKFLQKSNESTKPTIKNN